MVQLQDRSGKINHLFYNRYVCSDWKLYGQNKTMIGPDAWASRVQTRVRTQSWGLSSLAEDGSQVRQRKKRGILTAIDVIKGNHQDCQERHRARSGIMCNGERSLEEQGRDCMKRTQNRREVNSRFVDNKHWKGRTIFSPKIEQISRWGLDSRRIVERWSLM